MGYVDGHTRVYVFSSTNIASLSGLATTVDGRLLDEDGLRVLLNGQTDLVENGVYVVHSGAWTRAADFPAGAHAQGAIYVAEDGDDFRGEVVVGVAATPGGGHRAKKARWRRRLDPGGVALAPSPWLGRRRLSGTRSI